MVLNLLSRVIASVNIGRLKLLYTRTIANEACGLANRIVFASKRDNTSKDPFRAQWKANVLLKTLQVCRNRSIGSLRSIRSFHTTEYLQKIPLYSLTLVPYFIKSIINELEFMDHTRKCI